MRQVVYGLPAIFGIILADFCQKDFCYWRSLYIKSLTPNMIFHIMQTRDVPDGKGGWAIERELLFIKRPPDG